MRVDCYPSAPPEWPRKSVGEIAEIDPPYQLAVGIAYPFVEMASVREAFGGIAKFELRNWERSGLCRFKEGDLMLGKITPCAENGKSALVRHLPATFGIGSTEFFVLSPKEEVIPEFLFAAVTSGPFHRRLVSRMEGSTGRLRITRDTLKKWLLLPVPCREEQRRIVAVLTRADDAIQTARQELAATQSMKRSLMSSLFENGMPGRHRELRSTKIGLIPKEWGVRTIRSVLAEKPDSGTSPQSRPDPPGTPILNVSCVKSGLCNPKDVTYVDVPGDDVERYRALAGDFFVLRGNGNRDYVATGGLLRETPIVDTIYSDKLIRLRFNSDEVVDRFVPYLWQSKAFLKRLQSKAESGSGLWMMSKRDICRELFACPPLEEQKEIVELIDSTVSSLNAVAAEIEALDQVKRSLMQSLLTGKIRIPDGAVNV